jgi:hypothetical protein
MAVTYSDILTYAPGLTDPAEIVAALQADARHERDTNAAALYRVLVNEFQVLRVVNGVATGPLEDYMAGLDTNVAAYAVFVDGYRQFLTNPWSVTEAIRATLPEIGMLVTGICDIVAGLVDARGGSGDQVKARVDELTGGRLFGSVTLGEVNAAIDGETARVAAEAVEVARMETQQAWQDLYNVHISPVLDGASPTVENLHAAIAAMAVAVGGE